jgi:hypothetical protein
MNAQARELQEELDWLARVLEARLAAYFENVSTSPPLPHAGLPAPDLSASDTPWAGFIRNSRMLPSERLILALSLAPHLSPQLLDVLWIRNTATQRGHTEFGGAAHGDSGGFLPTGDTATFLLGGVDLACRLQTMALFGADRTLATGDILHLNPVEGTLSRMSGLLRVSRRVFGIATEGRPGVPEHDAQFPARRMSSSRAWSDLVLPQGPLEQLEEIRDWLKHGRTLLNEWGMRHKLHPGFKSLFIGPPGTGKTLSACLLGKLCDCDVYRIDLSLVVSKYIGETEKNLSRIFDQAEHQGWILFFDEADALFGKRTQVSDAHDRYANQEVSYLLQRIEDFDGVVILSSNLRHNIDEAFMRRFQSVVTFPLPRAPERLRLWKDAFPSRARFEDSLNLPRLADRHELTGGTIMNVARHASLRALARGDEKILANDVEEGIRRELLKEGRAY